MVAAYDADGTPSKVTNADRAKVRANGKASTARQAQIYNAGLDRIDPPEGLNAQEQAIYESGLDEADARDKAKTSSGTAGTPKAGSPGDDRVAAGHPDTADDTPTPTPTATPGGSSTTTTFGHQGAGALLGLIAYAVAINYFRNGTAGVTAWFNAKFLNQPQGGETNPAAAGNASQVASPPSSSSSSAPYAAAPGTSTATIGGLGG